MIRRLTFNDSKKYPFCLDKVLYAGQDFRWQPWGEAIGTPAYSPGT